MFVEMMLKWHDHRVNLQGYWFLTILKSIGGYCWNSQSICRYMMCVSACACCLFRFNLLMSVNLYARYPHMLVCGWMCTHASQQCTCLNDNKPRLNICQSIQRAWPQQWVHTKVTCESVSVWLSWFQSLHHALSTGARCGVQSTFLPPVYPALLFCCVFKYKLVVFHSKI